ncbi:hypothetical protein CFN78_21505 [Amycolatopsis antarctica]|uniref:SCO6045-like C-terminal domain-containing protein n=1 Tax=Amycolatopsis antarctica TaxID=1854586 RepID=A0A263CYT2_9PSEU|nr:hypothetical protein [Amycolatopsis antarctica]OZM71058.1 hypothetical protein CFN78_21505 [Amycolatopsis antarctica]
MNRREDLAAEQAALLRALLAGGEVPPGFVPDRVAGEVRALRNKRRKVVAYLAPELADRLGDRFAELFDAYAIVHPREVGTGARDDLAAFADWLVERGHLPRARRWSLGRSPGWSPLRGRRSR